MQGNGDYISREAAIELLEMALDDDWEPEYAADRLSEIPSADVRPVVRGAWEWNKNNGFYYCSKCGAISTREDQDDEYCDCPNFCHNCGADMRQEASDG